MVTLRRTSVNSEGQRVEDGDYKLLQNVGYGLPHYAASVS
jgi:hypothetical protein